MRTRFVINVEGKAKTVFKVMETKNSYDLNIHITKGGRNYKAASIYDLIAINDEGAFKECEKHISIHSNPKSKDHNTIKRTVSYKDGEDSYSQVQITSGIKKDDLFVPVLFRVCGDLTSERYALPDSHDDNLIELGQYNPHKDQLRFMLVCSNHGKPFPGDKEHPSKILSTNFTKFTLTVIWSYLNKQSHPQAIDFFLTTKKEEGPIRGFEWYEIYNLYNDLNMIHANNYLHHQP